MKKNKKKNKNWAPTKAQNLAFVKCYELEPHWGCHYCDFVPALAKYSKYK